MALTKVAGDILDPGLSIAGVVTATAFDGPFRGGSGSDVTAGVGTFTQLDVNGPGDFTGIVTFSHTQDSTSASTGTIQVAGGVGIAKSVYIGGDLVVNGTTTTIDTTLKAVDRIEVADNSTNVAVAITQSGSGDIFNLYDGSTEVFSVADGGGATFVKGINVTSGIITATTDIHVGENIAHLGDTDTKIVFTDNQIDLHANSASRLYINQHGAYLQTTFPLSFLASTGPSPAIKSGGTNNQDLLFTTGTNNPTRLQVTAAGKVGIGTDNPSSLLHLWSGGPQLQWTDSDDNSDCKIRYNSPNLIIESDSNGEADDSVISFRIDGSSTSSEKLRIDSSGNVLVGTTDTTLYSNTQSSGTGIMLRGGHAIDIARSGDLQLTLNRLTNEGPNIALYQAGGLKGTIGTKSGGIYFGTNGNDERIRITSGGQVHVGNATNNAIDNALFKAVADDGEADELYVGQFINKEETAGHSFGVNIQAGSSSDDHGFRVKNRANDAFHFLVRGDGKIGIGTDNPDSKLSIYSGTAGTVIADADADELVLENSGNVGLSLLTAGTGESSIYFGNPGTNGQKDGWIKYYHETHSTTADRRCLSFKSGGGSEKMRLDSNGRLLLNRTAQHASSSERLSVNGMTSIQYNSTSAAGLYIFNEDTTGSGTIQPFLFCHDGSGIRAGLGVQRSTGLTILNGQFGLSLRTGASGVGGTERLFIKSDGKVGIGTDNPAQKLEVLGSTILKETSSTGTALQIKGAGTQGDNAFISFSNGYTQTFKVGMSDDIGPARDFIISETSTGSSTDNKNPKYIFNGNGDGVFSITDKADGDIKVLLHSNGNSYLYGGNVGIGTDNPNKLLDIHTTNTNTYSSSDSDTPNPNTFLTLTNKAGTDGSGSGYYAAMRFQIANGATSSGWLAFHRTGDNKGSFTFKARNTASSYPELMRIQSDGKIGIGTNNPLESLHINSSTPAIRLTDTDTDGPLHCDIESVSGDLYLDTGSVHRDVIMSSAGRANEIAKFEGDGNVIIGGSVKTGNLSGRNILINGDMRIKQRLVGTSNVTGVTANGYHALDRWFVNLHGPTVRIERDSDNPGHGFEYSMAITTTTPSGSLAAGNTINIGYNVEGYDIARLGYGDANAKSFTLSFWVKSSLTGDFAISFVRDSRLVNRQVTVSSANTWEFKSVTIAGDTSTALGSVTTSTGMTIKITPSAGSNSTAGSNIATWSSFHNAHTAYGANMGHVTTNGAVFKITGLQMEIGEVATPFEFKPYDQELTRCKRYYQDWRDWQGFANKTADSTYDGHVILGSFEINMRANPTITRQVYGRMAGGSNWIDGDNNEAAGIHHDPSATYPGRWFKITGTWNWHSGYNDTIAIKFHRCTFDAEL